MKSNITSRLLENFDSTSFMKTGQPCKEILDFYDTPQQVDEFYRLTESAWPQIDWQKISKLKTNGWMVISFLCEASYKHCFPSLLMELKKNDNLLTDLFTAGNTLSIGKETMAVRLLKSRVKSLLFLFRITIR